MNWLVKSYSSNRTTQLMRCGDLNIFLQMRRLRQRKFNDLPRSALANDGSLTQAQVPWVAPSRFFPDRERVFGIIFIQNKNTLCLSLLPVSPVARGLSSLLSFSPFPSLPSPLSLSLPQLGLMFTPGWNVQECFIIRWSHLQRDAVTETT